MILLYLLDLQKDHCKLLLSYFSYYFYSYVTITVALPFPCEGLVVVYFIFNTYHEWAVFDLSSVSVYSHPHDSAAYKKALDPVNLIILHYSSISCSEYTVYMHH